MTTPDKPNYGLAVLKLAAPFMLGLLLIASVSLVDAYYIGQLGSQKLGAFGFTLPITGMLFSLLMGMGQGITSLVSRLIGDGSSEKAALVGRAGVVLTLVVATVLGVLGQWFGPVAMHALGASETVRSQADEYLRWWMLSLPLPALMVAGTAALRAKGDVIASVHVMGLAAVVNLALDPLLIHGLGIFPAFGISGAALATIGGYILATLVTVRKLSRAPEVCARRGSVTSTLRPLVAEVAALAAALKTSTTS